MTKEEAIDAIVRILRSHDGEAVHDLAHIAEIVASVPEVADQVHIGADA